MQDWEIEQVKLAAARDSWEDDDVADSWDAEEEEEEEVQKVVEPVKKAVPVAPKKTVSPVAVESSQESEQARKERLNRLIQESDLENAMALFGISKSEVNVDEVLEITKKEVKKPLTSDVSSPVEGGYFDNAKPQSWNEFETLSTFIAKKLKSFESSKHYPNFLETLFRTLLLDRDVPEIRKLANMASELVATKQKDKLAQMANKKKPAPSLVGASKKSGRADMMDFEGGDDDYDGF